MHFFVGLLVFVVIFTTTTSRQQEVIIPRYDTLKEYEIVSLWNDFKITYQRDFSTKKEEAIRYQNFHNTLTRIDRLNDAEGRITQPNAAIHGINKFSDWSPSEFAAIYLTATVGDRKRRLSHHHASKTKEKSSMSKRSSTRSSHHNDDDNDSGTVDWRGVYTGDVQNQGICGSCWAFSTAEQIAADGVRAGYLKVNQPLSVEQLVACDTANAEGCNGGETDRAFLYVMDAGGIALDSTFPYTSADNTVSKCTVKTSDYVVTVSEFHELSNEDDMLSYVMSTGPLSICVDSSTWDSYQSGILTSCGVDVDHCVQIVGVNKRKGYWIIRNSWGTDWGQDGYIYLQTGKDTCAITSRVTYSTVIKA